MDKYPSPKFLKKSLAFCVWLAIFAIACEGTEKKFSLLRLAGHFRHRL